ncbi:MAG: efflux RND transporter periplasmic adaptor subunit [Candidatus Moranbacteria bacterium]|nr:efflux RND transporter periplasmic adaptor subunit [Candidatus Moranbacteria bacterium]
MASAISALKKKYIWIAIILLMAGGSYYWYSKSKATTDQIRYVTSTAEKGMLTSSISASGNIIVDQSATVDPTITGTVADLAVAVGDSVKKGQFLFNIVNGDLTVSVAKANASLKQSRDAVESAKVDVKSAKADYDAAKKKEDKTPGTYTDRQLKVMKDKIDTVENKVTQAENNLTATQADYNNTLTEAGKRRVIAAIDGTVNAVNIKNGDDLSRLSSSSASQAPIIIGDMDTMKAQVQVNEIDIIGVSIGQKVMLKFEALDNFQASGKVEKMDSLGTITSGVVTYNVIIGFDSLDNRIKPEMSVSSSIITDVKQNVLIVPSSAVKNDGSGDYVEVLSGNTPEKKSVQVGLSNSTDTEIVSGLSEGDKVVTQTINSTTTTSTSNTNRSGGSSLRLPGMGGGGHVD